MHHYCHLAEEEILKLSLPKLKIYLEQLKQQVEYEIKIHGGEVKENKGKEATVQDIKKFFSWANAR